MPRLPAMPDPDDLGLKPENHDDIPFEEALAAQPNDAFFKAVFSDTAQAAEFFQSHLPASVLPLLDLERLRLVPGSFVRRNLQQAHSDLLFTAPLAAAGGTRGREGLLYLLFEHQTTPDPAMPLRLLGYIVEILLNHCATKGLPLPPLVGFVLHQGPDRWTASTAFEDLFSLEGEASQVLGPFLPRFRHCLLDLSEYDPAEQGDRARVETVLRLMKLAREKRLLEFFQRLVGAASGLSERLLRTMLLYALHADSELDIEVLARSVESDRKLRSLTMTVAEKLIAKGREEGLERGREEGLEKGLEKGLEDGLEKGRVRGEFIGRIRLLEELLHASPTPAEELLALAEDGLRERCENLQRLYGEQRENGGGRD